MSDSIIQFIKIIFGYDQGYVLEELFAYFFGIYVQFDYKNPSILTSLDSVDIAS